MATGGGSGPGSGNGPPMSGFGLGSTFPSSMGNISVMSGPPSAGSAASMAGDRKSLYDISSFLVV